MASKINIDNNAVKIAQQYENSRAFKNSLNLDTQIERSINFVEGRQWKNDELTDDYPKIVLNVVKQIQRVRQAGILQNDYSFLINTQKFEDAKKIQYFLKFLYNKLRIRKKNIRVVDENFTNGTSGLYFYWDKDRRSVLSKDEGELKCEVFDVRNLGVADPEITDIQDQEWIIYHTREKVEALKKQYPNKEIYSDGYLATAMTQKEQFGLDNDEDFVSVYIKFYRNFEGQVCYVVSTPSTLLQEPRALNQNYKGDLSEEPNTTSIQEDKTYGKYSQDVFGLYPFAVYVMDRRDNCFYGLPAAYEYIEAQKSINAHFATYDYAISQNVLGGFIMRKGALGDQELTTDNAQVLEVDLLPGEKVSDIFGRIPVNSIPTESLNFGGALTNMLKMVSGATNVQMGQADYANQTAKATEMLIQRARENTSDYAILFEEYMKDIASIMFMFAKFYYENKEFNIIEHGVETNTNFAYKGANAFRGDDYVSEDVDFDIRVSPSNAFNENTLIQLAMMSVQTGNLSMESVMKLLPYNAYPSYSELKSSLDKEKQIAELLKAQEEKIKELEQMLALMSDEYKRRDTSAKSVDTVIDENIRLKEERATIYAKSIETANKARQELLDTQNQILRMQELKKLEK